MHCLSTVAFNCFDVRNGRFDLKYGRLKVALVKIFVIKYTISLLAYRKYKSLTFYP